MNEFVIAEIYRAVTDNDRQRVKGIIDRATMIGEKEEIEMQISSFCDAMVVRCSNSLLEESLCGICDSIRDSKDSRMKSVVRTQSFIYRFTQSSIGCELDRDLRIGMEMDTLFVDNSSVNTGLYRGYWNAFALRTLYEYFEENNETVTLEDKFRERMRMYNTDAEQRIAIGFVFATNNKIACRAKVYANVGVMDLMSIKNMMHMLFCCFKALVIHIAEHNEEFNSTDYSYSLPGSTYKRNMKVAMSVENHTEYKNNFDNIKYFFTKMMNHAKMQEEQLNE